MEWDDKRKLFEAAKAAKSKPKAVTIERKAFGHDSIPWEEVIIPDDAAVQRFLGSVGGFFTTPIEAVSTGKREDDKTANAKLCLSVKNRLQGLRKGESWAAVVHDGVIAVSFQGTIRRRPERTKATQAAAAAPQAEEGEAAAQGEAEAPAS